jgi:hypothetical protein
MKPNLKRREKLTHQRVIELFDYEPSTGRLVRKSTGEEFGSIENRGYRRGSIDGDRHLAHLVVWFYVTGSWPPAEIDHKDTDRSNNRWENLRLAEVSQQAMNRKLRVDNTSGIKGVHWCATTEKWVAQIGLNNKKIMLGRFDDLAAAVLTVEKKRSELHGEFGRAA